MFILEPGQLTLKDIEFLIDSDCSIQLNEQSQSRINQGHSIVQSLLKSGKTIYGINTGFGLLAHQKISAHDLKELQKRIILSHAAGLGEPLPIDVVKLILLLKINGLAQGSSGVSIDIIQYLIQLYNFKVFPVIPSQGSVGASGDLAPLSAIGLCMLGEGQVHYKGKIHNTKDVFRTLNFKPYEFKEKEGLSLLNGTQVSTAIALMGLIKTQKNFALATIAGALSIDAFAGSIKPFHPVISIVKKNEAQIHYSKVMYDLLSDSEILQSHIDCSRVQDPYSLRCQPQVMGAVLSYLFDAKKHLINEANAVSDNPLICLETQEVISGGNFHAEIAGFSADLIGIVASEIGSISERRIAVLMDEHMTGLPPFLVNNSGLNSGFMLAQVTAASLTSENKTYAHPASIDSLPTSCNQEDHVSMATFAGMKLMRINQNVENVLAIETLAACQAIDFRKPYQTSNALQIFYQLIREKVAFYDVDRWMGHDLDVVRCIINQYKYYGTVYEHLFNAI
ncbi:MAG: histidine ammonia-lyase [Gammaproteobacteria bacterium]|nr:histidine ammonia-lyase [Gammaproteobacteria bacterium]